VRHDAYMRGAWGDPAGMSRSLTAAAAAAAAAVERWGRASSWVVARGLSPARPRKTTIYTHDYLTRVAVWARPGGLACWIQLVRMKGGRRSVTAGNIVSKSAIPAAPPGMNGTACTVPVHRLVFAPRRFDPRRFAQLPDLCGQAARTCSGAAL
jgi:hypothetical protein